VRDLTSDFWSTTVQHWNSQQCVCPGTLRYLPIMRSLIFLSLLLCGSMTTVTRCLNPQPVLRSADSAPEQVAQTPIRNFPQVFYHDASLARRSTGSSHARIARNAAELTMNDGINNLTLKRRGGVARFTTFSSGPPSVWLCDWHA
jgi:hypothetical protein